MIDYDFLVTSLVLVLIPGTGVLYTSSVALTQGFKASIAAAIGCTFGIVPHLTASILGLAALLHVSALAFATLKYIGVLYLLYLAWGMWHNSSLNQQKYDKAGFLALCYKGFLLNILNPKLSLFFLAFLPQFVSPLSNTPSLDMLILSLIFMAMTLLVFIGYGALANQLRPMLMGSTRGMFYIQRVFSLTFAALAAKLALTER